MGHDHDYSARNLPGVLDEFVEEFEFSWVVITDIEHCIEYGHWARFDASRSIRRGGAVRSYGIKRQYPHDDCGEPFPSHGAFPLDLVPILYYERRQSRLWPVIILD